MGLQDVWSEGKVSAYRRITGEVDLFQATSLTLWWATIILQVIMVAITMKMTVLATAIRTTNYGF